MNIENFSVVNIEINSPLEWSVLLQVDGMPDIVVLHNSTAGCNIATSKEEYDYGSGSVHLYA